MMTIWRIVDPRDSSFARAVGVGAWTSGTGLCPECGGSDQRRAQPLVFEWQPGSDVIASFTWTGIGVVVKDELASALKNLFRGFEPGPVEMVQQRRLQRPNRPRIHRVWLPYEGPPLSEMWVTTVVQVDRERSTIELMRTCGTCGRQRWHLEGAKTRGSRWNARKRQLERYTTPREIDRGLFVFERSLTDADIFRVEEFPDWILCTDVVKLFIEANECTNVRFLEIGEIS
jgi:hypothetical protein